MSASLASKAAFVGRRFVAGKTPYRTTRRAAPAIRAAAPSDDAALSRALRTVNTGGLMRGSTRVGDAHVMEADTTTKATTEKEETPQDTQETPVPTTAAFSSSAEIQYTLQGPPPKKFGVADGELGNVLSASGSFLTRAVSGALCEGWNVSLVQGECPRDTYTFGEFGGRYVKETSDVSKFARPQIQLELYEFEGCPFCKKVREAVIWLDLDVLFYPCPVHGGPEHENRNVRERRHHRLPVRHVRPGEGESIFAFARGGAHGAHRGFRLGAADGRREQVHTRDDARETNHGVLLRSLAFL